MAPEQAGTEVTTSTPVPTSTRLASSFTELLTGLRPFDPKRLRKAALNEVVRIIREEEPSRPSTRLSTDESLPSQAAVRGTEPPLLLSLIRGDLD